MKSTRPASSSRAWLACSAASSTWPVRRWTCASDEIAWAELAALLDPALCPYDLSVRDGLLAYLRAFDMPAVTDFVATPA